MKLILPLPPSPNRTPTGHWAVRHRAKRDYQRQCWMAAVVQAMPSHDCACKVKVKATFYIGRKRDEDNLVASLKWVLDALKLRQPSVDWRGGVSTEKGYFLDDDPDHLELAEVKQVTKRKPHFLELEIT